MAHKVIDRCKETTSTTGTGNLTLTGAASGFVTVASGLTSNGDTGWFCAEAGAQWEVFLGTRVSATELARTTLIASSTGSTVNFSSAPVVFSTVPGAKLSQPAGPAFRASRASSDQTVTTATWTKVEINSEEFDTAACFDSTTNHRFTPNIAGYYQFSFSVNMIAASGMSYGISAVYKNGAADTYGSFSASAGTTEMISAGAGLIYMNGTTDYVELYALMNGTSTKFKSAAATNFTGVLARPS